MFGSLLITHKQFWYTDSPGLDCHICEASGPTCQLAHECVRTVSAGGAAAPARARARRAAGCAPGAACAARGSPPARPPPAPR